MLLAVFASSRMASLFLWIHSSIVAVINGMKCKFRSSSNSSRQYQYFLRAPEDVHRAIASNFTCMVKARTGTSSVHRKLSKELSRRTTVAGKKEEDSVLSIQVDKFIKNVVSYYIYYKISPENRQCEVQQKKNNCGYRHQF
jgi:hypothetical protein